MVRYKTAFDDLMNQALCHPSYAHENECESNQRLEFIGDAVLQLIVTTYLYREFPKESEGFMSRARSSMVNNKALAGAAEKAGLHEKLKVGKGAESEAMRDNKNALADCFEAYIGALFQVNGYADAEKFAMSYLDKSLALSPQDCKSELQECLQANGKYPHYDNKRITGSNQSPIYKSMVYDENRALLGVGIGRSIRLSDQAAAANALKILTKAKE
jgi:ribonuclease-3